MPPERVVVSRLAAAPRASAAAAGPVVEHPLLTLGHQVGNRAISELIGDQGAREDSPTVQRKPLPMMPVGMWTKLRKKQTHSTQINALVTAYNELEAAADDEMKLKAGRKEIGGTLTAIEKAINSRPRAEWASKFGAINALEGGIANERERLRKAITGGVAPKAAAEPKKIEGGAAGGGILGPAAVKDLSPSKWLENLGGAAPDLDQLQGGGDGKKGAEGSTFTFTTKAQKDLIGKTDRSNVQGEVRREYETYKTVYAKAGRHPNLGNVHGWADLKLGEQHAPGMLMDKISGMDGRRFQVELKSAWDDGIIKSEQYWSALQYITEKMLEVLAHLNKAGLVHNDMKPENYVIDKTTGEPIVIDLGGAAAPGEQPGAITNEYAAPEMLKGGKADIENAKGTVASDVFTVGSSLQHAVEAPDLFHRDAEPNQQMRINPAAPKPMADRTHTPFQAGAHTKYTDFIQSTMGAEGTRPSTDDASGGPGSFLRDRILDDLSTRAVIMGVADGTLRAKWVEKWKLAGKVAPASKKRSYKIEVDKLMPELRKDLDRIASNTNWSPGGDLGQIKSLIEEADQLLISAASVKGDPEGMEGLEGTADRHRRRVQLAESAAAPAPAQGASASA